MNSQDIFSSITFYWPWFVLGLCIALGLITIILFMYIAIYKDSSKYNEDEEIKTPKHQTELSELDTTMPSLLPFDHDDYEKYDTVDIEKGYRTLRFSQIFAGDVMKSPQDNYLHIYDD